MATVFVGVRALSGVPAYAHLALLGAAILALTGPFGPVPGFSWGQLAASSHPVDVEMNVIVPIALSALFMSLSPFEPAQRDRPLLFVCMALGLSAIHQRELFQLWPTLHLLWWCYAVASPPARSDLRSSRAPAARSSIARGPQPLVPVCELFAASKAEFLSRLGKLDIVTAFLPLNYPFHYDFSFLWGLNGLMLVATGLVLVRLRYSPAVRTCGLAVAGFGIAESFAIVTIPVLLVTYEELFTTPVRHVLYCCSSIAFAALLSTVVAHAKLCGRGPRS
jgi:hypothetical protein